MQPTAAQRRAQQFAVAEIRRQRKRYRLRQVEVAHRLGVTHVWMSRVESGKRRVDIVEFMQIAHAIGFDQIKVLQKVWSFEQKVR
jgi:transcriptional regulator with XRE-family HTH domain